jgi:dipeptidyl aminopeptidase/acylaminoacyl peptidase
LLRIAGESWDRRYYLVFAMSDTNAGVYYRFDTKSDKLEKILDTYPLLEDFSLGKVTAIEYPSDDGVIVPGYMTIPADGATGPLPTILMPHGGPYSRDEWGFDWLAQFLANRGYVVLQSNYRGSAGYGDEWAGDGAFKGWKRAMVDLEYGLRHLVAEGITDPTRVCTVGWSYGGYAALMSAIEYPERHRCVVSIAGVTDLQQLLNEARSDARVYVGRGDKVIRSLIGKDPAVIKEGSPQQRADELEVPVLLFHGYIDQNVPVLHSQKMKKALPKKQVEYIEYEGDDHQLRREENRIDMLRRIGNFLEVNLTPKNNPEI